MRTQEEIVQRFNDRKDSDVLGFEVYEYPEWLTFENVQKLGILEEGITEKEWENKEPTFENILSKMKDYINFAYEKAQSQRGISSCRSLYHYKAWVWLLDDGYSDEFNEIVDNDYSDYGVPVLDLLTEKYNLKG